MTKHNLKFGLLMGTALVLTNPVAAADLGGNCCADLEERIAELEATTARKGNRKVSLNVYGQINKSLLMWDADDATYSGSASLNGTSLGSISGSIPGSGGNGQQIIDNSIDPSYVGFAGTAKINNDLSASYVLEIGVGGYTDGGALSGDTNDIYVKQSFVNLKSESLGGLTLGKASQATDNLDKLTVANTAVAMRPLSLRPLTGPEVGDAADLFDGNTANVIRYDTPIWAGFVASASWAAGDEDDSWDIALRYAGEFSGFKLIGGAGYRHGIVLNDAGGTQVTDEDFIDLDTWTVTGSAMHIASGLFIGASYGSGDGEILSGLTNALKLNAIDGETTGWQINGGVEQKWFSTGKTTFYAEYGDVEAEASWSQAFGPLSVKANATTGYTYWGLGAVQSIDAAAMDIYATLRFYEFENDLSASATDGVDTLSGNLGLDQDATVGQIGARIRF
jgi:predicted porin